VARDANGILHLFGQGDDGTVWTIAQNASADWGRAWRSIGGPIAPRTDIAVAANADGRLEVFVPDTDGAVWHAWQTTPGAGPDGWTSWASLGGRVIGSPRVARNANGTLEVFACGTDHGVWHIWQAPSADWGGTWSSLGGSVMAGLFVPPVLDVAVNDDGRLEVFIRGADGGVWHSWQPSPGAGPWSGWTSLGGAPAAQLAVAGSGAGPLSLIVEDPSGAHAVIRQQPSADWGGSWIPLGGPGSGRLAMVSNADGRMEAFAVGTDNAIAHAWEMSVGGPWSGWESLGGIAEGIGVGANADGRIELFHVGLDQQAYHIWQVSPNNGWNS
jgi:hypothetical protein